MDAINLKNMRKLLFLAAIAFITFSCEESKIPGNSTLIHSNSFVGAYYTPITLKIDKFNDYGFINISCIDSDFCSIGTSSSRHTAISEYYGDTGYDTTYNYVPHVGDPEQFLSDEIESIEISCTSTFNEVPAGSILNEQFYLYAMTVHPYIQSNYTSKFNYETEYAPEVFKIWKQTILEGSRNKSAYLGDPIYESLDKINYESLKLIGGSTWMKNIMFLLQIKQIPSNPEGDLIISITFKGGKQLEARAALSELV